MFTLKTKSNRRNRDGITIVEVLTSIVVAMIGVFGVMVMIPFAVQQAQSGLDLDDSSNMADNATQTLQILEYHRINEDGFLPWIDADATVNDSSTIGYNFANNSVSRTLGDPSHLVFPGIGANTDLLNPENYFDTNNPYTYMLNHGPYWLDPLGIEAGFTTTNIFEEYSGALGNIHDPANGQVLPFRYLTLIDKFSDSSDDGVPDFIDRDVDSNQVLDINQDGDGNNIADPFLLSATAISRAYANQIFRTNDDLQFSLESDQNGTVIGNGLPPQQIFDIADTDGDGTPDTAARQSRGELSWSMVLVPEKSVGETAFGEFNPVTSFNSHMLIYKDRVLQQPLVPGDPLYNEQFDPRFKWAQVLYDFDPTTFSDTPNPLFRGGNIILTQDERTIQIPKNGWVMMVNRFSNEMVNAGLAEPGFLHQVGFYRVIGTDPVNRTLTLDGPEFDFGEYLNGQDPSDGFTRTGTYIVYLQDVVNVYQRTLRWEGASSWNR